MQNIELLAPAGSYEALVAAVQNGANAIYLGGNEFSARAFATNFNREELQAAVAYGHLRNVKIYVTVNTLYEDNQFEKLQDYLLFLQTIKVDALIIQDIGLMSFVKQTFQILKFICQHRLVFIICQQLNILKMLVLIVLF